MASAKNLLPAPGGRPQVPHALGSYPEGSHWGCRQSPSRCQTWPSLVPNLPPSRAPAVPAGSRSAQLWCSGSRRIGRSCCTLFRMPPPAAPCAASAPASWVRRRSPPLCPSKNSADSSPRGGGGRGGAVPRRCMSRGSSLLQEMVQKLQVVRNGAPASMPKMRLRGVQRAGVAVASRRGDIIMCDPAPFAGSCSSSAERSMLPTRGWQYTGLSLQLTVAATTS
mmetsp:Transcript_30848/g.91772  ORF Transcript_30848/g.91772 Transcript_30848/m.91772 type:complete len:223 (+) Transcript_30848:3239-3907(+)